MENNEIMNYEEIEEMDNAVEESESTGMSTGVAMLIGAGLACAIGAGVKLVKKGIAAYKAKKALRQPDNEVEVDDQDIVETVDK